MSDKDTGPMDCTTDTVESNQKLSLGAQPRRNHKTFGDCDRGGLITYCSNERDLLLLIESSCGALCKEHFRSHPQDHPALPFSGCSSRQQSCYLAEITERAEDETGESRRTYLFALEAPEIATDEGPPIVMALLHDIPSRQFQLTLRWNNITGQESILKGTIAMEHLQDPARGITEILQSGLETYHGNNNPPFVQGLTDVLAIASGERKRPFMQEREDNSRCEPSPLNEDAEELFETIVSRLLQAQKGWPARFLANSEHSTL